MIFRRIPATVKLIIIFKFIVAGICEALAVQYLDHSGLMTAQGGALRSREPAVSLGAIANDWKYDYDIRCPDAETSMQDEAAVVAGKVHTTRLPSGVDICASDLISLHDNHRTGIVNNSIMIAINLGGSELTYSMPGRSTFRVPAGSAFLLFASDHIPLDAHYRKGERSRLLVMQYYVDRMCDPQIAEQMDRQLQSSRMASIILSAHAQTLASNLVTTSQEDQLISRLRCESCAFELLACAIEQNTCSCQEKEKPIHARDRRKIQMLCDMMQENLGADFRLCDLAKEAGMSMSTLKSKFSVVTGQTVFQFLREHRLEKARIGLEREGWTVSEAAFYVGYGHATNFSSAFRKRFGYPPAAARRSS